MGALLSLLNPLMLWGATLVAAPVLIHLLSRRRKIRRPWAAMHWLVRAERVSRRRVRIENLLLLLLRCLALLLLALAMARPVIRQIAGWNALGDTRPVEHVILLDDSASMQWIDRGESLFSRATFRTKRLVEHLAQKRPKDRLTLLTTSSGEKPRLRSVPMGSEQVDRLLVDLQGDSATFEQGKLEECLASTLTRWRKESHQTPRALYILSDMQRIDWMPEGEVAAGPAGSLRAMTDEELAETIHVGRLERTPRSNLAITRLEAPGHMLTPEMPAVIRVHVENTGLADSDGTRIALSVNDAPARYRPVPSLAPGENRLVTFVSVFSRTGAQTLLAELPPDSLSVDNRLHGVVRVSEDIPVLLVNGATESSSALSVATYLAKALSGSKTVPTGFDLHRASTLPDPGPLLDRYSVIALCNWPGPDTGMIAALHSWVHDGGTLILLPGDGVREATYNRWHERSPDLFPARLLQIEDVPPSAPGLSLRVEDHQHPALRLFAGDRSTFRQQVAFRRWWRIRLSETGDSHVSVCAQFDNEEDIPFWVESVVGRGRTVLLTSPAMPEWNNWALHPSFVVSMIEMFRNAGTKAAVEPVNTGEPIYWRLDAATTGLKARLHLPEEAITEVLQGMPGTSGTVEFRWPYTPLPGLYSLVPETRLGQQTPYPRPVRTALSESAIDSLDATDLRDFLTYTGAILLADSALGEDSVQDPDRGLWRTLLLSAIAVLLLESFLSHQMDRRRDECFSGGTG